MCVNWDSELIRFSTWVPFFQAMDGVNVKCVRRINFSIVLKRIVFSKVFTCVRQTRAPLQWFYPVYIHASVSHLNQDCISIYAFFFLFCKGFVSLRYSLRLHSKHQQIWLYATRAMINVMEMIVNYAIKLFQCGHELPDSTNRRFISRNIFERNPQKNCRLCQGVGNISV